MRCRLNGASPALVEDIKQGRKSSEKLMYSNRLRAIQDDIKQWFKYGQPSRVGPSLGNRDFVASKPDNDWATDITSGPELPAHSNQESPYGSDDRSKIPSRHKSLARFNRSKNCFNNPVKQSFFSSYKMKWVRRKPHAPAVEEK